MKLTQQQIDDFNREGCLFLPELSADEEVAVLRDEAELHLSPGPSGDLAREIRRPAHRLCRPPLQRSLLPARPPSAHDPPRSSRLFGEQVYMHQYKINAKASFTGDVWQWHQDYGTWARDDGMPEPRAMNIAVFLDEVMPINGPLMLVPRSQTAWRAQGGARPRNHVVSAVDARRGNGDAARAAGRHRRTDRQARRPADVPRQSGARLGRQHHAVSAEDRVSDAECGFQLHPYPDPPGLIAHRDFRPIQTVDDDSLVRLARGHRQAAE